MKPLPRTPRGDGLLVRQNLAQEHLRAVDLRVVEEVVRIVLFDDLAAVHEDHTIGNLQSVSTNTQASQGRIQDADFASETSALVRAQILSQAATAMLAQANASKQTVLTLLQG